MQGLSGKSKKAKLKEKIACSKDAKDAISQAIASSKDVAGASVSGSKPKEFFTGLKSSGGGKKGKRGKQRAAKEPEPDTELEPELEPAALMTTEVLAHAGISLEPEPEPEQEVVAAEADADLEAVQAQPQPQQMGAQVPSLPLLSPPQQQVGQDQERRCRRRRRQLFAEGKIEACFEGFSPKASAGSAGSGSTEGLGIVFNTKEV